VRGCTSAELIEAASRSAGFLEQCAAARAFYDLCSDYSNKHDLSQDCSEAVERMVTLSVNPISPTRQLEIQADDADPKYFHQLSVHFSVIADSRR